jgi:hypothetical protein
MAENNGTLSEFATCSACFVRCISMVVGLSICVLLSACDSARRQTSDTAFPKPLLSAIPNPVPTGDINQPLGTTTISWNTGDGSIGDLYVKVNRESERFIAQAPSGTQQVRWIQFDSLYEFRLYNKKHSKLLAKLEVTRDD